MFAEAARRLIIVDDVDDFADDPNPLEKRSGDRHSTAFGRGLDAADSFFDGVVHLPPAGTNISVARFQTEHHRN
jgi:hypothetical protein